MKTRKTLFLSLLTPLLWAFQPAHNENDTTQKADPVDWRDIRLSDDPFVARLDSLVHFNFFAEGPDKAHIDSRPAKDSLWVAPQFSDSIYHLRLEKLNARTPLELEYNPYVKRYIEVYSLHRREQVSRMMGLAEYYYPMFEEVLDRYEMPLELKHLAVVESALNPMARSRVGATGLWQFMYGTGRMQGLKVSSYIDERSDPLKSTEAACQYMLKLYSIFEDWNLVLAAYNAGPGNVNKAIRRSGGQRNYWDIRPFLPRETAGYVPAFIAVNYVMNYAPEHQLYPTEIKPSYFSTDTVWVKEKVSFEQVASLIGVDREMLEFLNPGYRHKIVPKNEENPYYLILPSTKVGPFITHEDSIYAIAQRDFERKSEQPANVEMNERTQHIVSRGEVLGTIAEKYGVSVASLRRWNGLRGNTIRIGQRLTVYPRKIPAQTQSPATTASTKTSTSSEGDYLLYRVSRGETLYSIARKYPGVSAENIMGWNNIGNARYLKEGMSLKIYPNS